MKKLILVSTALMLSVFTQFATAKTDTVRVMTTAVCDMCKERIEHDLSFEKGIKSSNLDLKSKMVTVVYNPKKTNVQKIREAITRVGYDADSLKANEKSYDKLPECCKRDVQPH